MTCELFLSVMYINVVPCICFIIVRLVHSQMLVARELLSSTVHVTMALRQVHNQKASQRPRGRCHCVSGHNGEAYATVVSHHSHVYVCTPPPSLLYHSQPIGPYRLCVQAQQQKYKASRSSNENTPLHPSIVIFLFLTLFLNYF